MKLTSMTRNRLLSELEKADGKLVIATGNRTADMQLRQLRGDEDLADRDIEVRPDPQLGEDWAILES